MERATHASGARPWRWVGRIRPRARSGVPEVATRDYQKPIPRVGNARVLREVLFNYEVVLSRQHVAFECVRSEVLEDHFTCTVSPLSDPEGRQDR